MNFCSRKIEKKVLSRKIYRDRVVTDPEARAVVNRIETTEKKSRLKSGEDPPPRRQGVSSVCLSPGSGRRYFSIGSLGMSRKKSRTRQPSTDSFFPRLWLYQRISPHRGPSLSFLRLCIDVGAEHGDQLITDEIGDTLAHINRTSGILKSVCEYDAHTSIYKCFLSLCGT